MGSSLICSYILYVLMSRKTPLVFVILMAINIAGVILIESRGLGILATILAGLCGFMAVVTLLLGLIRRKLNKMGM